MACSLSQKHAYSGPGRFRHAVAGRIWRLARLHRCTLFPSRGGPHLFGTTVHVLRMPLAAVVKEQTVSSDCCAAVSRPRLDFADLDSHRAADAAVSIALSSMSFDFARTKALALATSDAFGGEPHALKPSHLVLLTALVFSACSATHRPMGCLSHELLFASRRIVPRTDAGASNTFLRSDVSLDLFVFDDGWSTAIRRLGLTGTSDTLGQLTSVLLVLGELAG
jgi:hypothetical protein